MMDYRLQCLFVLYMADLTLATLSGRLEARQSEDPAIATQVANFWHRIAHASIVVGNYLYIDGGEIAYRVNNKTISEPANSTYSIDLSQSWQNSTVPLTRINKQMQTYNRPNLWSDLSNTAFYSYNGVISPLTRNAIRPPGNQLWKFTPSGNSGAWSVVGSSASSNYSSLVRAGGTGFASGKGVGYAIGGQQNKGTTWDSPYGQDASISTPIPGIVAFNSTSGSWSNTTLTGNGFVNTGSWIDGQLIYVPSIGREGVLIPLGGGSSAADDIGDGTYILDFQTIYMYDISSQKWYNQRVNGSSTPTPRRYFCAVGAQGDDNTYEIFIYGGQLNSDSSTNLALDSVWVLSLPSFTWQKSSYTPRQARSWHTCNIVGKRQMLVVGGGNPADSSITVHADIWSQGLNIFDMTDMVWTGGYNHSANAYVTPNIVKQWYKANGRYPSNIDPTVQSLFTNSNSTKNGSSGSSKGSNTGAIAGGVVGGILGISLIAGLIWFFLRRRKRSNQANTTELSDFDSQGNKTDIKSKHGIAEAAGYYSNDNPTKHDYHQRHEMTNDSAVNELHDTNIHNSYAESDSIPRNELPGHQYTRAELARRDADSTTGLMTNNSSLSSKEGKGGATYELPGDSVRRS